MTERLPVVSGAQLIRALERAGWNVVRQASKTSGGVTPVCRRLFVASGDLDERVLTGDEKGKLGA